MSEEQLKAFLAKAKDDQSIQEKLKAAKSPEDVVGIANWWSPVILLIHLKPLQP